MKVGFLQERIVWDNSRPVIGRPLMAAHTALLGVARCGWHHVMPLWERALWALLLVVMITAKIVFVWLKVEAYKLLL